MYIVAYWLDYGQLDSKEFDSFVRAAKFYKTVADAWHCPCIWRKDDPASCKGVFHWALGMHGKIYTR